MTNFDQSHTTRTKKKIFCSSWTDTSCEIYSVFLSHMKQTVHAATSW